MRNLESIFDGAEKSAPNPFREDVFAAGITSLPGVTEIHGDAMTRCIKAFESLLTERGEGAPPWGGSGRTLLIAAPRAGYGKSHLVGRVRAVTESLIAPVALPFDPAREVAWETVLVSVFNQYRSARCPQHPGCSLFEETVRFFQSRCVCAAVDHGAVVAREIPETEVALRLQFRDVFHPQAETRMAQWLTKRSPEILDAVAEPLGRRWRLEFDDLVFWNRFFQDASRPKNAAFEQLRDLKGAMARDRLVQFLRIASDCRPLAFIADHLDGFFGSDSAGMRIAEILTELRFAVPRSVTLLCLNEDVWQSVFEGKIPSAWIDRLTGEPAPLSEMSDDDAESLLLARLQNAGYHSDEAGEWLRHHRDLCLEGDGGLFPRELLRRAAREWDSEPTRRSPRPAFPAPVSRPTPDAGFFPGDSTPKKARNVFSAADESKAPPAAPRPAPEPKASARPRTSPTQPAPFAETRMDDPSAAARAAGIDPTRGLTNVDDIIAEIRGGGARALSETQSPTGKSGNGGAGGNGKAPGAEPGGETSVASPNPPEPKSAVTSRPYPFQSGDPEGRLRQLEAEALSAAATPGGRVAWESHRLARLISAVGGLFPAVAQVEESIEHRPCLAWSVRGASVWLGFEAPEHFAYWSRVLDRVVDAPTPGKVVLFSHASAPFDQRALVAMGADPAVAARHLDIVELSDADLARFHAAERFLDEAETRGSEERAQALRVIARRLDSFWRRLGRPLVDSAGAAG